MSHFKKFLLSIVLSTIFGFIAVAQDTATRQSDSQTNKDTPAAPATYKPITDVFVQIAHSSHDIPAHAQLANCASCHNPLPAKTDYPLFIEAHRGLAMWQGAAEIDGSGGYLVVTVHNPLGVEVGPVDSALRAQLQLGERQGVVLVSVPENCEGANIGLQTNDVVISIDQHEVTDDRRFQQLLTEMAEKDVQISFMRGGKMTTVATKLPAFHSLQVDSNFELQYLANQGAPPYRIGVTLNEPDATLRAQLKLADGQGLVVSDVVPDSPAAGAGIQANDILVNCNGNPITTVEAINAMIQEIKSNPAKFTLIRTGQSMEIEVTPRQEVPSANENTLYLSKRGYFYDLNLQGQSDYEPQRVRFVVDPTQNSPGSTNTIADLTQQIDAIQKSLDALKTSLAQLQSTQQGPVPEKEGPENSKDK
ncbi:MAG: PDZ domain-containing protein [Pirellulaceae bacterium]